MMCFPRNVGADGSWRTGHHLGLCGVGLQAHLFDKQLWSELGFGDALRVLRCSDEHAEAEQVATIVRGVLGE